MTCSVNRLTLYFDGACPLCVREIGLLRRLERGKHIDYLDISPPDAAEYCPIPREVLLARFTAKLEDGQLVDGAQAFTEAWSKIPWLIWLRPIGRFAPTRSVLNFIYAGFLKIRPFIQRKVRKWSG